jgi:hypothetical protein
VPTNVMELRVCTRRGKYIDRMRERLQHLQGIITAWLSSRERERERERHFLSNLT